LRLAVYLEDAGVDDDTEQEMLTQILQNLAFITDKKRKTALKDAIDKGGRDPLKEKVKTSRLEDFLKVTR